EQVDGLLDAKSEEKFVTLQDAIIEGAVRMRSSILPGLLDAVRLNLNHQRRDLKLFEIGKVFAAKESEDGLPNEREFLTLVLTGSEVQEAKSMAIRELDFFDLKGAVEAAFDAAHITGIYFGAIEVKHLRKGQAASISIGETRIGAIGRLNDDIAASYKFRQPVYVGEIDLQAALSRTTTLPVYQPLAKYPGISRDVSFVAKRNITYASINDAIRSQQAELLRAVEFVDVYEGKGLADDERSITVRLEYLSPERTLVEDEVEALHEQLVTSAEQNLGIKRRF
ncbi:MAG TPA: hypothetical protein VGI80_06080, partial [Pyrinomonadaceae bacterium]